MQALHVSPVPWFCNPHKCVCVGACVCGCGGVGVGGWVPRDKQKHKFAPQVKVATVTAALSPVSNASGHLEDQETWRDTSVWQQKQKQTEKEWLKANTFPVPRMFYGFQTARRQEQTQMQTVKWFHTPNSSYCTLWGQLQHHLTAI